MINQVYIKQNASELALSMKLAEGRLDSMAKGRYEMHEVRDKLEDVAEALDAASQLILWYESKLKNRRNYHGEN